MRIKLECQLFSTILDQRLKSLTYYVKKTQAFTKTVLQTLPYVKESTPKEPKEERNSSSYYCRPGRNENTEINRII